MSPKPVLLPPRALLLALLAQLPLLGWRWPPRLVWAPARAGAGAFALGAALNLTADRSMHDAKVEVCPFHDTPELVVAGPYRFTRNPMYFGMALIAAAPAVVCSLWLNLAPAIVLAVWLHYRWVLPEEKFLAEKFGDAFRAYCRRTPRWVNPLQ